MAQGPAPLDGLAYRLRPVGLGDAAFIVWLRTQDALTGFVNPISGDLEDQERWTAQYLDRDDDDYFIVERMLDGRPEGAVALYDIGHEAPRAGEWGRWVLRPGSLAAVESAHLIYRHAFEARGLERVYCRTVADNLKVVSFHDSCGIEDRRLLPRYVTLNGVTHDSVEHTTTTGTWPALDRRLGTMSAQTARLVQRMARTR